MAKEIIKERERFAELNKILNNPEVKFCYIVKRGVYYRPNNSGYTQYQHRAGVYTKEDAVSSAKRCDELWVRPINIEEHNRIITSEIKSMQENLIKVPSESEKSDSNCNLPNVGGMLRFITTLRQTDRYIEMIYLNGACYQFHLLLKTFFPESEAFISKEKDHVVTKYNGKYYDITGEVSGSCYTPMAESEIDMVSGWSFHRTKVIQIGECPHCEEPIVI